MQTQSQSLPKTRPLARCLGCNRVLISDVYSLCMRCCQRVFDVDTAVGGEEFDVLYFDVGGEGGGA